MNREKIKKIIENAEYANHILYECVLEILNDNEISNYKFAPICKTGEAELSRYRNKKKIPSFKKCLQLLKIYSKYFEENEKRGKEVENEKK